MASDSIQSQVKRLAHNGIALAAGGIVAQLAFTLLEILIARKLGADAYGVFVTAYAWTVLGAYLMEIGTPYWTIQEGSRSHDRLPELLGSGLTISLSMFAVLYILLVIVATTLVSNPIISFMLILLPYGLILTLQNHLSAVYASYQTMHVSAFYMGIAPVAILVAYFFYSWQELTLPDVGFAFVVGSGIVTGAWFASTLRRVRPHVRPGSIKTALRGSYPYGLSGILFQVFFKADVVLISMLAGVHEAGIYAAAFKLVDLVGKVSVLAGRVFSPTIFKSSHESEKSFQMFTGMMLRVMALAGLLAGVVSFVLAEELILLMFGENYAESVPVLRILGGVMATMSMLFALQPLLSSIDLHFERVTGMVVAVVVHIGGCALLIPKYGATGAAISTLFSGGLIIVLYAYFASRKRKFRFVQWLALPSFLAATVAAATVLADMSPYLGSVVAVAIFLASLLLTRFVHLDEIRFILQSVAGKA